MTDFDFSGNPTTIFDYVLHRSFFSFYFFSFQPFQQYIPFRIGPFFPQFEKTIQIAKWHSICIYNTTFEIPCKKTINIHIAFTGKFLLERDTPQLYVLDIW
ncbi:hypothetical protein L5515_005146 [Caenorhabditis briggsae]|uniref:Uncharacterized protein n=1 Tax=Caenorhabditis briggsae TaxID=6238 RepID=A0AAE9JC00_CAEBR|nr:hypothetical protein L5515_005146 [Caenorhabditis briggsae]